MHLTIANELKNTIPNFKIGLIFYNNIEVIPSPQMIKGRIQLFQESIYFDLENANVNDIPSIKEWRQIFKTTGKDPNRYRHSAEALFRRIKKQNYLQPINSSIDLNNFFSLQFGVPIGIYDCANLSGNLNIRIGKTDEQYIGLNGRTNSIEHLIISEDEQGPFGSPFVDSDRAPVTLETKNAVQIVYLQPSTTIETANKMVESLTNMFVQIHGGKSEFYIVD
ncbi:B3/B4 domain-containing protein [Niallia sp. 01092]|uniref:B3/B4 domain-containing protein n=1 Tax=unclassified Niallia TaxID=2837522 RepID=UPI003FCF58F0